MEQELQDILQALLQCVENHLKGDENKEWFVKLIQDSLNGTTNQETDIDLIYNATVIENILVNLLTIDIRIIVKVRMVHKIINTLWEENKWDTNLLNSYILNNKPTIQENPRIIKKQSTQLITLLLILKNIQQQLKSSLH